MPDKILLAAAKKGIHLHLKEGALAFKAPKGALTAEIRDQIVQHKEQIIRLLQEQEKQASVELIPVTDRDQEKFPLSFAQQRLWLLNQMDGGSHYNMPGILDLKGPVDVDIVSRVFSTILERHEVLRTVFGVNEQGQPFQTIKSTEPYSVDSHDLSLRTEDDLRDLIVREISKPFDLCSDNMLRACIIKLADNTFRLIVTMHHIASDGWSMAVLTNEFCALYAAYAQNQKNPLYPLPVQYVDYACWQRNHISGNVLQRQLDYWKGALNDAPSVHSLPLDKKRPQQQSFRGGVIHSKVNQIEFEKFDLICKQLGASQFMGIYAAFSLLLSRYSNETDIVIGSPIAAREQSQIKELIGYFGNTLVLRTDLAGGPSFRQCIERCKQTLMQAYDHQNVSFEQIVEVVQPERTLQHSPIFQIMLVMHNNEKGSLKIPGIAIEMPDEGEAQGAKFDLTLSANIVNGSLELGWEYSSDLFEKATIENMASAFSVLIANSVSSPDENAFLLGLDDSVCGNVAPNHREVDSDRLYCIYRKFEQHAKQNPEAIAVTFDEESVTYSQLNKNANRLARYLRVNYDTHPNAIIGICLERSIGMIEAILAVFKSGCAYLPIDPDSPDDRIKYILNDANPILLLTQQDNVRTQSLDSVQRLCLEDPQLIEQLNNLSGTDLADSEVQTGAADLCYVIYTSGSTGKPKGVQVEHGNLSRLFETTGELFSFNGDDVWTMFHSFAFDFSVWEIWGALFYGARLVVVPSDIVRSPIEFYNLLQKEKITVLSQTPSAFNGLIAEDNLQRSNLKLRYVIFGGEALDPADLTPWVSNRGDESPELINMYGITETTVHVTYKRITSELIYAKGASVIGTPLPDLHCLILNEHKGPVPDGGLGELYVGGDGVTRGYLNRDALTTERFVVLSQFPGRKFYRSGDLVRKNTSGELEYHGRIDNQVKLRGFRIELGEIENALESHPLVEKAIVLLTSGHAEEKQLLGFVKLTTGVSDNQWVNDKQAIERQIKDSIRAQLPSYMVPSSLQIVIEFPLTINGKIDQKALFKSITRHTDTAATMPENAIQQQLLTLWSELLHTSTFGIDDNFFEIGGNSLLAVTLQVRIREEMGIEVNLPDIFTYSTIRSLSNELKTSTHGEQPEPDNKADTEFSPDANVPVAIVGMSGRFPGADNVEEFWQNICDGIESITDFSDEQLLASGVSEELLANPNYIKKGFVFERVDQFDAKYFGFTPKEAELSCPQLRILLEIAVETLESAGYGNIVMEQNVGVFVGASTSHYFLNHILPRRDLAESQGTMALKMAGDKDFIASRIAYLLNLVGPAVSLNTACSTSAVAVAQACLHLAANRCDMALAGAASISQFVPQGYLYEEGGIYSPDGHCRPFDQNAQGTRDGDGAGLVLLKRLDKALSDGDTIHAVIRGVGINNDGSQKVGYTAPGATGQVRAIQQALRQSQFNPETIEYIETHGTATNLGDPIEFSSLKRAMGAVNFGDFCALGSVKANIGHLDAAAGIAGLIKTVQALKHKMLPPSINFETANKQIDFGASPFYINHEAKAWTGNQSLRRAGVSSFGIGGTNVHILLEESPVSDVSKKGRDKHLFLLSANTQEELEKLIDAISADIERAPRETLADIEYTLQTGRSALNYRKYVVVENTAAGNGLRESDHTQIVDVKAVSQGKDLPVVFMFTGQGAQYVNMLGDIYAQEQVFREVVDQCCDILEPIMGCDLRTVLFAGQDTPEGGLINDTRFSQPCLFVVEYALAKLIMFWGVVPSMMIGHSIGEYVAACISGVFRLEDALKVIACRGQLMQATEPGAMLSVLEGRVALLQLLKDSECDLAVINGPSDCVVSGSFAAIDAFKAHLDSLEIAYKDIKTSHAFHSRMMEPVLAQFENIFADIEFGNISIPFVSNLSGKFALDRVVKSAAYWCNHLRNAVEFSNGVTELTKTGDKIFVEIGPGDTLSSFVKRHRETNHQYVVTPILGKKLNASDALTLIASVGQLWQLGVPVDWHAFHGNVKRKKVALPTYPFNRRRYWVDEKKISGSSSDQRRTGIKGLTFRHHWERDAMDNRLPQTGTAMRGAFVVIGDSNDLTQELINSLHEANATVISVNSANYYEVASDTQLNVNLRDPSSFRQMLAYASEYFAAPFSVIHLASIPAWESFNFDDEFDVKNFAEEFERGTQSLLLLVQEMLKLATKDTSITVITHNVYGVTGSEPIHPSGALLSGIQKSMRLECPEIPCYQIDIDLCDLATDRSRGNVVRNIVCEVFKSEERALEVAVRQHRRWKHSVTYFRSNSEQAHLTGRRAGAVVITGGTGQIAIHLSAHLAENAPVKIALIHRREFPAVEQWTEWCETHDDKDEVTRKIRVLQQAVAKGTEIRLYQCDVSDCESLEKCFRQIEGDLGEIEGVIHAAALAHGIMKPIQDVTEKQYLDQFQTKVIGLHALDRVISQREPQFVILMSSLASVLGGLGFAAYAGVNAYMDAFAVAKNTKGSAVWLAINWDRWDFNGGDVSSAGVSVEEGLKCFSYVRTLHDIPQILISKRDLTKDEEDSDEASGDNDEINYASRTLDQEYVAPRTKVETDLAVIWQDLLGVETIGIHDNLFDLGGHSLLAIQLISKMKKSGYEILVRELIESPTIAGISEIIAAQLEKSDAYNYAYKEGDTIFSLPNRQLLYRSDFKNHWNVGTVFNIQDVQPQALEQALRDLLEVQEGFRHVFFLDGDWVREKILPLEDFTILEYMDLSAITSAGDVTQRIETFANEAQQSLDLSRRLFRFVLFKSPEGEPDRFLWIAHHSIMDGYSVNIFFQELFTRYLSSVANVEFTPFPKTHSVLEWANYLHQYVNSDEAEADINYWDSLPWSDLRDLADYPEGLRLNKGLDASKYGADIQVTVCLAKELTDLLIDGANVYKNISAADVIFSTFTSALAECTASNDVRFEMIVNGRDKIFRNIDIDRTIGWFADWVPVVISVDDSKNELDRAIDYHQQFSDMPKSGLTFNAIRCLHDDETVRDRYLAYGKAEININFIPPALRNMDQIKDDQLPMHLISPARESAGRLVSGDPVEVVWSSYVQVGVNKDGCYEFSWMGRDNAYKQATLQKILELWVDKIATLLEIVN